MAGFWSGLVNAGASAAIGADQGKAEAEKALLARLAALKRGQLEDAQIANLTSEAKNRVPPAYHPTSRAEATDFYKDTHPKRDYGPPPGSPEWFDMQHKLNVDRAETRQRFPSATTSSRPLPIDRSISQIGSQIKDTRADIGTTDRELGKYSGAETTNRANVAPEDIPQFIADSTAVSGLNAQRRRFTARSDSLNTVRDQMASERSKELGLSFGRSPTSPTAGAGGAGMTKSGVPPEAQALFDEAARAFQREGDVAKYNATVAAISRKYRLSK